MRNAVGKEGASIALVIMAVFAIFSFVSPPPIFDSGENGICVPSPNLWQLPPLLSWSVNFAGIIAIAVGALFSNKKLVFVPGQDYVFPALFLITVAANPWLTSQLNASTILCAANLGCLYLLMNAYGHSNATQEMFVIATIAGLGAMFMYAFVLFIPVYLICASTLQLMRPKELCAFGLGLFAPYWTLIGLGIVSPADFALPDMEPVFNSEISGLDIAFVLIELGLAVLAGLIAVIYNSLKLFNTSVRLMLFNRVICICGLAAAIFACIDFTNFFAYIETILLVVAIQVANLAATSYSRYTPYISLSVGAAYIILFLCIFTA